MKKRQRIAEENHLLLDLWHQSQTGDSVAFCRLADKLYRTLFNYACNFTSDREFVKDALQELMINVWEKRHKIEIQFVTIYFLKALRNQLLQEFRKTSHSYSFLDIDEFAQISDNHTIENQIEQKEIYTENLFKVRTAIDELPKRQREAVFLKYYEGMENEQIADLMQVNRQSVANLLFKALSTLRSQVPATMIFLLTSLMQILSYFKST